MNDTLDELTVALQKINPRIEPTETQRAVAFVQREAYLTEATAPDRAYQAQLKAEKYAVQAQADPNAIGLNLPR